MHSFFWKKTGICGCYLYQTWFWSGVYFFIPLYSSSEHIRACLWVRCWGSQSHLALARSCPLRDPTVQLDHLCSLLYLSTAGRWTGGPQTNATWLMGQMEILSILSSPRMKSSTCSPLTSAGRSSKYTHIVHGNLHILVTCWRHTETEWCVIVHSMGSTR